MTPVSDLTLLLRGMAPVLYPLPYGYGCVPAGGPVPALVPFARITEEEGTTLIAPLADLAGAGFEAGVPWARISLTVASDLQAVGLTAAFATALAARGLSANVVAGFHHDHIFVPWARRDEAMAALRALSDA